MIHPGHLATNGLDRTDGKGAIRWVSFNDLPFVPGRLFWISDFDSVGKHACLRTEEALFVLDGEVSVLLERHDADPVTATVRRGSTGFLIPAGWWRTVSRSPGSSPPRILVLASGQHDPAEVVHDRGEFMRLSRVRLNHA